MSWPGAQQARHFRRGYRAAGWIFIGIGVLLVLAAFFAVLGARGTKDTYGLPEAVAVMLAMAVGSVLLGRHFLRESARRYHHDRVPRLIAACACFAVSALLAAGTVALLVTWVTGGLSDPIGLVYPATSAVALAQAGRVLLHNSRRAVAADDDDDEDDEDELPARGRVAYREACSDLNPLLVLVMVAVLALGIWLLVAFGGNGQPGPQGFLVVPSSLSALWLVFLLQFLPYGIVVTDSYLQLGVRGVPRAGRLWLRARIPLDAVSTWDVMSSREYRKLRAADRYQFPRWSGGDMVGFLMGARHVLCIRADPQLVRERFPDFVMSGLYSVSSARRAGLRQNGIFRIGTRRPTALESALAELLPDRHETGRDHQELMDER
jgi:hypothetical protein